MTEMQFLRQALYDESDAWRSGCVEHLANMVVPDSLLGRRRSMLKGDVNEQWARWFIESIADPRRISATKLKYASLFEEVRKSVDGSFLPHEKTQPEKQELATTAARIIFNVARKMGINHQPRVVTKADRMLLLGIAGSPPRCWCCGAEFSELATDNFLLARRKPLDLPPFVDVYKPRGLIERDLSIEIDHVHPFSRGGQEEDNLKLACGWCNRHKSAHLSIYDVEGQPRSAGSNSLGISSVPQPFWVVRLLALSRSCEHPHGCTRSVLTAELTVVAIREAGALNPTNLRATCLKHDPLGVSRLQPPSVVKQIWSL